MLIMLANIIKLNKTKLSSVVNKRFMSSISKNPTFFSTKKIQNIKMRTQHTTNRRNADNLEMFTKSQIIGAIGGGAFGFYLEESGPYSGGALGSVLIGAFFGSIYFVTIPYLCICMLME